MDNTPRLGLRTWDGSDPFLREDFNFNFDTLDANPGIYICTSTTRPSGWTGSDLGRLIYERDTGRLLSWNNPGWISPEDAPYARTASVAPNENLGRNGKKTYTLRSITVRRPSTIIMIGIARIGIDAGRTQNVWIDPWINGSDASVGPGAFIRQVDNGTSNTLQTSFQVPVLGARSVEPGDYNLQARVTVGDYTTGVQVGMVQLMAFLGN